MLVRLAMIQGLLAFASVPAMAAVAPPATPAQPAAPRIEAREQGQTLTELSYERYIEESLRQSLASYLGADQFILQVRVGITPEREIQQQPPVQNAPVQPPQPQFDDLPDPEIDMAPALPGLGGVPAEDQFARRINRRAPQPPQLPQPLMQQAPVQPAAVTVPARVERIRISVVLPNSLKSSEDDFVKNMIFQKADLNFARGDTLEITRRDFPRGPMTPHGQAPAGKDLPGWLWGLLGALGASVLVGGIALLRRKPEAPAAPLPQSLVPVEPANENKKAAEAILASLESSKAAEPLPVRQELMVQLLERPEAGERYVRKLLSEEEGLSKAATLTKLMGMTLSKRLFTGFAPTEWKAIELAALDIKNPTRDEQKTLLEEAYYALLRDRSETSSSEKATPFAFLSTLDDPQLIYLMEDEGPRVQALILSQVPPDRAVGLMRLKPPAEQGAIAAAMGELHLLPMAAFHDLARHLAEKASEAPSFETAVTNGLGLLVNLLDHSDRATEQGILSGLSNQNPRLFAAVKDAFLTFDDLARVPREVLKDALREVDKESLAEALREAPGGVREAILASLTDRARRIVDEVLAAPPVGMVEEEKLEATRKDLVSRVRQLLQAGRFSMKDMQTPKEDAR